MRASWFSWCCWGIAALFLSLALIDWLKPRPRERSLDLIFLDAPLCFGETKIETVMASRLQENDRVRAISSQDFAPELWLNTAGDAQRWLVICADRDQSQFEAIPQGVSLFVLPSIPVDSKPGFELRSFSIPEQVVSGRPFWIHWKLFSRSSASGHLRFWVGEEIVGELVVDWEGGEHSGTLQVIAKKPGLVRVRMEALDGNSADRPAQIYGYLHLLEAPKIQVIGPASPLVDFFEKQGFRIEKNAANLDVQADAWLISDARIAESSISDFLQYGGGVLFLAGESLRSQASAELRNILPVKLTERVRELPQSSGKTQPAPGFSEGQDAPMPDDGKSLPIAEPKNPRKEKREAGVVALALVIDKSGSMAGVKLARAREAALAAADTLSPEDYLMVVAFDRETREIVPMRKIREIRDLREDIDRLEPGGGTRIFPALSIAAQALEKTPAAIRHLILLTDGATEDKHSQEAPYYQFTIEKAKAGITTSTVGLRGEEYDTELLSNLALWGKGRFYPVESEKLPQIFTLEANRVRESLNRPDFEAEGPAKPKPEDSRPLDSEKSEPKSTPPKEFFTAMPLDAHPIFQAIDWKASPSLPQLKGAARCTAKLGTVIPLKVEETGEPLLALGYWGEGRVAFWASDGGEYEAEDWFTDARARQLFSQLMEFLRRREESAVSPMAYDSSVSEDKILPALFPYFLERQASNSIFAERPSWGSGASLPESAEFRSWSLGSDPEHSLQTTEQRLRSIAVLAARTGGELMDGAPMFFERLEQSRQAQQSRAVWIWISLAGVVLLVELFVSRKRVN